MTTTTLDYRIVSDTTPMSPREWDNVSILALFHGRYALANEHGYRSSDYEGWDEMRAAIADDGGVHIIPVFMYDHGSVTLATGERNPFSCPWDSGQIGFAFTTKEKMEYVGAPEDRVESIIEAEVQEYSKYLSGDAWGYEVLDDEGNVIDSCYGFLGYDVAEEAAREYVKEVK